MAFNRKTETRFLTRGSLAENWISRILRRFALLVRVKSKAATRRMSGTGCTTAHKNKLWLSIEINNIPDTWKDASIESMGAR